MTVDARIKQALEVFGDPVTNGTYTGQAIKYYTFNYSTLPNDFADDKPQHERFLIQIHLFASPDLNINLQVKETKYALLYAGFQWPTVTNASDEAWRHMVFETESAEEVEYNGQS